VHAAIAFLEFSTMVGWNNSRSVTDMPLAIAAMSLKSAML
jgi:hypothetical protein